MKLWGKICLTVTVALGSVALGSTGFPGISQSTNTKVARAATTINAENQGMIGNSSTINNKALQNMIDRWSGNKLVIHVPKGIYKFETGNIFLHSNITFKFDKGAIFRSTSGNFVGFIYPSPNLGYDGGIKNIRWEGATFQGDNTSKGQSVFCQSIHHATNVSFDNCVFNNAESPLGHYLDLDGSHDISIKNSTFIGFNGIQDSKEAIQIDYSNIMAMSYKNPGDKYDNLPTYDVTIDNNKFLPIYKKSGQICSYAPNPVGEHSVFDNGKAGIIHDIRFTNNTVIDPKPLMGNSDATIRFIDVSNLWIENNKFINQKISRSGNYIYLNNIISDYRMKNLNIRNNTFTNITPNKQYIFLNSINLNNPMLKVKITGNKIASRKSKVSFVRGNFNLKSNKIKISNNKSTNKISHNKKYYSGLTSLPN